MKIKVTYKFTDAIDTALDDADLEHGSEERAEIEDAMYSILGSSEYLTVEVDTEAGSVTFVKRR